MKKLKHTFRLLNLVFFISSFAMFTLSSFANTATDATTDLHHVQLTHKHGHSTGTSQQLSESNETEAESEYDLNIGSLILPFFVSWFQFSIKESRPAVDCDVTAFTGNPIYMAVRNFRL